MNKKPEELRKLEDELVNYEGEDKVVSSHDLVKELDIDTDIAQYTGVPSIDRILKGVEPGEMIIVSGPTGEGKTSLLMSITRNMAYKDVQSLWFTLEVTPRSFIRKIRDACGEKMPLFFMPRKNTENQLQWIEERIIEAKVKYNVEAIFIDHIHQIFSLHKVQGNVSLEIGDMVGKIKQMAVDYNLVIFLIAHCKDNSTNPNAEPRKEEIRDSGLISRLADAIIMVWRIKNGEVEKNRRPSSLDEDDIQSKVRIAKNRREGQHGTFVMQMESGLLNELTVEDYV